MEPESVKSILFTAAAIFISYLIIKDRDTDKEKLKYLISSLVITLVILSVMVFKLHHFLRFTFQIPNTVIYLLVLLLLVFYLLRFKKMILESGYIFLILALSFFAMGILIDLISDAKVIEFTGSDTAEEIFGISGAFFWLLFFLFPPVKRRDAN